jgi:regulator of extracellular matrix RemA (YlzA/DUF370 family)
LILLLIMEGMGAMGEQLLNLGYGHVVVQSRVVAILSPGSAPMKRLREEAKKHYRLIDATQGKKTRSLIITDSNHVILSAFMADTIAQRYLSTDIGRAQTGTGA